MADINLSLGATAPIAITVVPSVIGLSLVSSPIQITAGGSPIGITVGSPITFDLAGTVQGPPGPKGSDGSIGGVSQAYQETPSGVVDGSNRVFTLTHAPVPASMMVFVNGLLQILCYTLTGSTVTFDVGAVPVSGDQVYTVYQY